jgi:hypothetical protein
MYAHAGDVRQVSVLTEVFVHAQFVVRLARGLESNEQGKCFTVVWHDVIQLMV